MLPRKASVLPFESSMNMLLMNRLFSAVPMVFTCDGFYGLKAQPHALYSRRPVNVKVGRRGDHGRQRTGSPEQCRAADDDPVGGLRRLRSWSSKICQRPRLSGLHLLKIGLSQIWHDPMVNGTNDAQE